MPSKDEKRAAIEAHKAARQHLEQVSRGITEETDAYLAANQRVIDTEKNVPWYRR